MRSVTPIIVGAVSVALGLATAVLGGRTSTLVCHRVESNQIDCLLTTDFLGNMPREIEIRQLQSARVQRGGSATYGGSTYRVMLVGGNGDVPLTLGSTGRPSKQEMADRINAFIADPSQPSLKVRETSWWVFILGGGFLLAGLFAVAQGIFPKG